MKFPMNPRHGREKSFSRGQDNPVPSSEIWEIQQIWETSCQLQAVSKAAFKSQKSRLSSWRPATIITRPGSYAQYRELKKVLGREHSTELASHWDFHTRNPMVSMQESVSASCTSAPHTCPGPFLWAVTLNKSPLGGSMAGVGSMGANGLLQGGTGVQEINSWPVEGNTEREGECPEGLLSSPPGSKQLRPLLPYQV